LHLLPEIVVPCRISNDFEVEDEGRRGKKDVDLSCCEMTASRFAAIRPAGECRATLLLSSAHPFLQPLPLIFPSRMIRREPTMIPLGELDVQEVKDAVNKKKRSKSQEDEDLGEPGTSISSSNFGAPAASSSSNAQTQLRIIELNRRREAREERLGMR